MPSAASRAARLFFENQGKCRESGTERTSAIAVTPAPRSIAIKRSAGMLEWPMLRRSKGGMGGGSMRLGGLAALAAAKFCPPLAVEGFDALAEIVGLPQAAIAMPLELDGDGEGRVFGIVQQLLGRALRQRREGAQLVDQRIGCRFQLAVGNTFGGDAPVERLPRGHALRAHHDVLGAGDADHLLQSRRAARSRNLA